MNTQEGKATGRAALSLKEQSFGWMNTVFQAARAEVEAYRREAALGGRELNLETATAEWLARRFPAWKERYWGSLVQRALRTAIPPQPRLAPSLQRTTTLILSEPQQEQPIPSRN